MLHEGITGPLAGLRVVEFAGAGPAPFAAMMLADMGADVISIKRPAPSEGEGYRSAILERNRRSVALDLKAPEAVDIALRLIGRADALIEGFRPGVMERLGLGPERCQEANPALVYGRMTGWGQTGPLANTAGHDINYLALSGALSAIGTADGPPVPPANMVADFGGGGMMLAFGLLAAIFEARGSGRGQVVDAAMLDGTALLMVSMYTNLARGTWSARRGENRLDGGCYYYRSYRCADDAWIAVGAIEPQFNRKFLAGMGIDPDAMAPDGRPWADTEYRPGWAQRGEVVEAIFARRSRQEWLELFSGVEACVTPVLGVAEAMGHAHNVARGVVADHDGLRQPAPAPRLSRTPGGIRRNPVAAGSDTATILAELGFTMAEVDALAEAGVVGPINQAERQMVT